MERPTHETFNVEMMKSAVMSYSVHALIFLTCHMNTRLQWYSADSVWEHLAAMTVNDTIDCWKPLVYLTVDMSF